MRNPCRFGLIMLLSLLIMPYTVSGHKGHPHDTHTLEFVENKNQWHENVLFKANFSNGSIFAEKHTLTYLIFNEKQLSAFRENKINGSLARSGLIDAASYKMKFVNANPDVRISGSDRFSHYHNYYLGDDPSKWASGVSLYNSLVYQDIYNGIDLHLLEKDGYFKYEFIVAENVSPDEILLEYEGTTSLALSNQDLVITTSAGQVRELSPRAFQLLENGDTLEVPCKYKIEKKRVRFLLGNYRNDLKLIIDPTLIFSTFSGSTADNWGFTATYDNEGNLYGGGITSGNGYPLMNAFQVNYAGMWDIAISKFNATGTNLYFSTYLGGRDAEFPSSMVVNHNNELYILGTTSSLNFPVTTGSFNTTFAGGVADTLSNSLVFINGSDIVISKFKSDGSQLLASTYVGGSGNDGLNLSTSLFYSYADEARGEIILDNQSNVYVASSTLSSDFPVTPGVFQPQPAGGQEVCIFKMNHNLSNLIWSSYLGGASDDAGYSIVTSSDNSIYVCGGTNSDNFPVTADAVQSATSEISLRNKADGFITHIDEFGTRIMHSTYLGTSYYDQTYCIKNDRYNNPHVVGQTTAPGHEWISNATWFHPASGQFITKLTPRLDSIIWSTSFGTGNSKPNLTPTAFMVDVCNNIYYSGWGGRNNGGNTLGLPVTSDAFQRTTDGEDFYFLCIDGDASTLKYATFFGGNIGSGEHVDGGTSRFDKKGRIYQAICAGCGSGGNSNFPVTPGAWSEVNRSSNCNLGAVKMDFNLPIVIADFTMPNIICAPYTVNFINNSQELNPNTTTYLWNFGDGTTSTLKNPAHDFNEGGLFTITLIVTDPGSCNFNDTLSLDILVMANTRDTLPAGTICEGEAIQIGIPPHSDENISYLWLPREGLNNPAISNPVASPAATTEYILYISDGICSDTLSQTVEVILIDIEGESQFTICAGDSIKLSPTLSRTESDITYFWSVSPDFNHILNRDTTRIEITVAPGQTTTYYLKVKLRGCIFIKPYTVTVSYIETVEPLSYVVCFDEAENITVEAVCHNCNQLSYRWAAHSSIISDLNQPDIRILPEDDQSYYVTITNEYGCEVKDTVNVTKQKNTFPSEVEAWCEDCTIIQGDTCILFSTVFEDGLYTYQWLPASSVISPNSASAPAVPVSTTIFTVMVTDIYGCTKSDTVLILVENTFCGEPYIFVPNAFTPNGDHKNDVLYVRGERVIRSLVFRIYNRWGEMVFESKSLDSGWDGTYKGEEAPPGVYDYYLEAVCDQEKNFVKKGNVTLIR